jgi:hypothetical protein
MVCTVPPEWLLSVSNVDYSNLILGLEGLATMVGLWRQLGPGATVPQLINGVSPLVLVRGALIKCPDESPSPLTSELLFITEDAFRETVRNDVSTANSAFHNGEWKAATVLAGSAIEALLLWKIQSVGASAVASLPNKPKGPPENWDLSGYINVAKDLNVIKANTAAQAELAKFFRNLIHPGRAVRKSQVCDRGTALAALAALEFVVRDFS